MASVRMDLDTTDLLRESRAAEKLDQLSAYPEVLRVTRREVAG